MQIYADVTGLEMKVARSAQTCALGSAIAGAVAAGAAAGGHKDFAAAQAAMCGVKAQILQARSRPATASTTSSIPSTGSSTTPSAPKDGRGPSIHVMKDLLAIRDRVLAGK